MSRSAGKAKSTLFGLISCPGAAIFALLISGIYLLSNARALLPDSVTGLGTCGVLFMLAALLFWFACADPHSRRLKAAMVKWEKDLVISFREGRTVARFGGMDEKRWNKSVDDFLHQHVVGSKHSFHKWRATAAGRRAAARVKKFTERKAMQRRREAPAELETALDITWQNYERRCAELLEARGWATQMTKGGGDGGADIIADKGPHRLVVQCKRSSSAVPNSAVQAVHAARDLYDGTLAVVVAPSGFTAPARNQADRLGVELVHHYTLPDIADAHEQAASTGLRRRA